MPMSIDGSYTPIAVGDRRDRNPNQYNPLGAELAKQLGVEYDPEIHNIGDDAVSLVNNPEALAKYKEMLQVYGNRHDQRDKEFRRTALKTMAALAVIAVTAGAASGAFSGTAGTTAGSTAGTTAAGVGKGVGFAGQAAGAGATKGAIAVGAAGQAGAAGGTALGTGGALGAAGTTAAAGTGGGLTMATVPTIAGGSTAAGGIAVPSIAGGASAAAAPTVTAGSAGMFSGVSTSQWLKMGLSAASSAYSGYMENKSREEQAEFAQKESRRMQQWEADRINRIRSGPLAKLAPFIMQDALNIYGGRGSQMNINTVMNMMGVSDLSGMTPFQGFGQQQDTVNPQTGNRRVEKAMGA